VWYKASATLLSSATVRNYVKRTKETSLSQRKAIITLLSLFLFAFTTSLRASPPIGAVVQTWQYDSQSNRVTATIVNTSNKDITAYNISIKETYADGHVNTHELLCEYAGRMVFVQEFKGTADEADIRKQFGDGLFHPGESRNEIIGVQSGLKDFAAVVDVVAYADQTAEATNNDGLQRLLEQRKASVASTQMANEIIQAALADPNDADPAATAANKLQDRITVWKAQTHTTVDFEPGVAKGVVDELRAISSHPLTNKRDALTQYLAKSEKRIATFSPHAELTKIGGPQ
jgi:hypothetical protein